MSVRINMISGFTLKRFKPFNVTHVFFLNRCKFFHILTFNFLSFSRNISIKRNPITSKVNIVGKINCSLYSEIQMEIKFIEQNDTH